MRFSTSVLTTETERKLSILSGERSKQQENARISPNPQLESFLRPKRKLEEELFVA